MVSSVITAAIVLALAYWHFRNRRRPGWNASDEGRSYLLCGYSVVASSTYWLWIPPVGGWEWTFAGVWALGGLVAFVLGFNALNRAAGSRVAGAQVVEPQPATSIPRQPMGL